MFRARSIGCLRVSVGSRVRILFGVYSLGFRYLCLGFGGQSFWGVSGLCRAISRSKRWLRLCKVWVVSLVVFPETPISLN